MHNRRYCKKKTPKRKLLVYMTRPAKKPHAGFAYSEVPIRSYMIERLVIRDHRK